jgi:hypothetical protein
LKDLLEVESSVPATVVLLAEVRSVKFCRRVGAVPRIAGIVRRIGYRSTGPRS